MNVSTEAKVGAVSVLGLILLIAMIVQLGGISFQERGYPVYAVFNQVGGLKAGNAVRYAGVDIGRVEGISVVPEGVKAQLMIQPGMEIPEGSRFMIGTDGLLGEKFVDIIPPRNNSGMIRPGAVIRGEEPQGLDTMVANADKVLLDVQKLVGSLNEVFGDEKVKAALKESAVNTKDITAQLNTFSASLARMAQNNEADISQMIRNLNEMSASLRVMAASFDNNGQTTADLTELIRNLKNTSIRVEKMAAALEGVVTDPETAQNIRETLRNTREVTSKANKTLGRFDELKVKTGFEVLANTDGGKRIANGDVRVGSDNGDFAVIGARSIGDNTQMNVQFGRTSGELAGRAGLINGEAGVGIDTRVGKTMRLSLDVYDPNDVRVKLRSQFKVAPDTYLVGETDSINKDDKRETYVGVRRTF